MPVPAAERQIGLRGEGGDPDTGQVGAMLVDDEAPLPGRKELAVEEQEVVELEAAFQPGQGTPLRPLERFQFRLGRQQRGERREIERDTLVTVRARPLDRDADKPLVETVRVVERLLPSDQPGGNRSTRSRLVCAQSPRERACVRPRLERSRSERQTFFAFYVGAGDKRFREENAQLDRELDAAHVAHVFVVYPGAHERTVWKAHARAWLELARRHLASPR
jgi:hypothetical protein